jgi:hypothetical protein
VKGDELHRVEVKLWEGLSCIGRGCGGLPTVDREVAGEELERRRCSEARGEMRVQERANWREGQLSVFNRLPTEGYTQGGKFWVRRRRDQELEGTRNTELRQVRAARCVTPYVL